ncbi:MAG TPA: glycosyltransferase [Rhodanobacteraceae bacterium]|nr:glycosyltransferase [Rhodanobacteraceae bacterium]
MHVLHIGKFWPPYAGGIERSMRDLCVGLVQDGITVDVLAHAAPGDRRGRAFDDAGIAVRLLPCLGQLAYAPVSPGFPLALHRALQRKPDLLHLHLPNPAAFWALLSPAARALPWVLQWQSDIPADAPGLVRLAYPLYRPWERALLARAACVIASSPNYRDASTALAPWRDKTRVLPLGLPPDTAKPVADGAALWPGQGLRLLAVGRLSHYKGFNVLLDALAQTPGVQLLLIGAGECAAELAQQVTALGLGARVRLAGAVDDATRDAAYAAAEMFCLPSIARSESFGMVLLEAMRASLPTLASDVPGSGMHFVLDGGRAGRLVPPNDAPALAAALTELAADPASRRQLATAGHARWQSTFTLTAMAAGIRGIYADVLVQAIA